MTAKQKATTKKRAGRRPSIKDRARAIVADLRHYDVDTRNAVARSLEKDSAEELAEIHRLVSEFEKRKDPT